MAVEPRRGCGHRKIGGLYLVGGKLGLPCCKMPIPLCACPTCGTGVKQARGWTWIDPQPWLKEPCSEMPGCPAADPASLGERVGLLWVGTAFYKTVGDFLDESSKLGISRRINAVPRGFVLGEHWVFLAHPHAITNQPSGVQGEKPTYTAGIFRIFKPTAIEKIVTATEAQDEDEMTALQLRGITPVVVPDSDLDHQGSVWDNNEED